MCIPEFYDTTYGRIVRAKCDSATPAPLPMETFIDSHERLRPTESMAFHETKIFLQARYAHKDAVAWNENYPILLSSPAHKKRLKEIHASYGMVLEWINMGVAFDGKKEILQILLPIKRDIEEATRTP